MKNLLLIAAAVCATHVLNAQQLTQSLSQTVQEQSYYVSAGENFFSRSYHLPDYDLPQPFAIAGVEVGISAVYHASGAGHFKIRLYETSLNYPENFRLASHDGYALLAEHEFEVPNQHYTTSASPVAFFPLSTSISHESNLVVEVSYDPTIQTLFLGMNMLGETGQSYLMASGTDTDSPQPLDSYYAAMPLSLVLNVVGTTLGTKDYDMAVPALYPNPTNGRIYIATQAEIERISVIDILGRTSDLPVTGDTVDIGDRAAGAYMLRIAAGGKTFVRKVVKVD